MTTSLAYLFEKISIEVEGKYETFYKKVDVVYGACYLSKKEEATFHVFTGDYVNSYAHILKDGKYCPEVLEFVVQLKSLDDAILENNRMLNFLEIRDNLYYKIPTYFKMENGVLKKLNEDFIKKYIDKQGKIEEDRGKILKFPKNNHF